MPLQRPGGAPGLSWARGSRRHGGSLREPLRPAGRAPLPGDGGYLWELRKDSPRAADQDPVFASQTGTPIDSASLHSRVLKPAAERAGVGWAGFHTLRHTAATTFFRAGWNAKQVQMVLGHHSPAFTLESYVHLLADGLPDPSFLDAMDTSGDAASAEGERGLESDAHAPSTRGRPLDLENGSPVRWGRQARGRR